MDTKKLSVEQLRALIAQAQEELQARELDDKVTQASAKLKGRSGFTDMFNDMVTERWLEEEETAFKAGLLKLGVKPELVEKLLDLMGDASNMREEFQDADDEDPEYGEFEAGYDEAYDKAFRLLDKLLNGVRAN